MKTLLFKPFEKYSEKTLLFVGFIVTMIGSFLACTFGFRFDGVIDLHLWSNVMFYQTLLDNLINISCLFLFLYVSAKYLNRKTRLIDIFTTVIIARTPLYILPFFNVNGVFGEATEDIIHYANTGLIDQISFSNLSLIIVFAIFSILFLVWYVSLLFNGFKVASNAKGVVSIVLFIVSLLFAEILSKTIIIQLSSIN